MKKYTLIITEKPDAAKRIANALDVSGKAKLLAEQGVPYYWANRNGDIVVVPALGHLYTVASANKGKGGYPIFDYQWVPRYQAEREASRIRVWLKIISKLAKNADKFIDACDFDIEGSIIGYCILKYACENKQNIAQRMKYSTLTEEELQESFDKPMEHLDFALIEAGLARHEIDWLYGINLSRALTSALKNSTGQYATLSTGRVQGPTLKFLEIRERNIRSFVPTPFWILTAKIKVDNLVLEAEYEKRVLEKAEADRIADACTAMEGVVEKVEIKESFLNPPVPFDLGSLQNEAYRLFGYTPMRTLSIAQHLYLNALISYPRTSSQRLPQTIGYKTILQKLSKSSIYGQLAAKLLTKPKLTPNEGKKIDPAHPAIYPTGNLPTKPLNNTEKNVFDLIVKRFFAVFGEPAVRQSEKAAFNINGRIFVNSNQRTLVDGWLQFYKPYAHLSDTLLPSFVEGQEVFAKKINVQENFTKPPPRYNPRSLLVKMEKEELGTKATRAGIMQTLFNRKYISSERSMIVTELGFEVIEVLRKYSSAVISSELTRELEGKMSEIQSGKKTKDVVLAQAIEIIKPITKELKENEAKIGLILSQALKNSKPEEKISVNCPVCFEGKLVILRSKKSGKRFVGCTNYFEKKCNAAFPLPQNGLVKLLRTSCKSCNGPTARVLIKAKQPWNLCLDPNCPSKRKKNNEV